MPSSKAWAQHKAKPVSNFEWTLRDEFELLGLLEGSFMNNDFPFNQEIFEETGFKGTNIDRDYPDLKVAFFFDGPHHKNLRQAQKDEIITRILKEKFGYHVRRWMFEKGNKGLARVIADEAKEFLDSVRQLKNFVAQKLVRSCRGCHKEIPEGFALCPNCYPNACYTKNITEKIAGASS